MNNISKYLFAGSVATLGFGLLPTTFAASVSTTPVADAFVAAGPNLGNNNYGGGGALAIAAAGLPNGEFQSVLRFDLSGLHSSFDAQYGAGGWFVQSVSLQLSSSPHNNPIYNEIGAGLFGISLMQDNSWVEGTGNASSPAQNGITFNSLQNSFINGALDQPLGTFNFGGGSSGLNSYTLDLTSGLNADLVAGSTASLRLFAADNAVSYLFSSRSQSSGQPQLVVVAVPEPGSIVLLGLGAGLLAWRRLRAKGR